MTTIDLPGKFDSWFDQTGLATGADYGTAWVLDAATDAYKAAVRVRRGRGYALRLTVPDEGARDFLLLLREYAGYCIDANREDATAIGDDQDTVRDRFSALGETQAARRVIERVDAILSATRERNVP